MPSMTVLSAMLALAASIGYGFSDALASIVLRRQTAASLAVWGQLTGLALLSIAVVLDGPPVHSSAIGWGSAAGMLGAAGVLLFYSALQRGPTSIVTPISGTGVAIPVIAGLIGGENLEITVLIGILFAFAGVVVIAAATSNDPAPQKNPHDVDPALLRPQGPSGRSQPVPVHDGCRPPRATGSGRTAILLAIGSALSFGFFFVVVEVALAATVTGGQAVGWSQTLLVSASVQVGALAVTLLAATRHSRQCLKPNPRLLAAAGVIGVLDVSSDAVLTYAIGVGPLAVVGPLGSLDPVVTVVIAAVFLRDRIDRGQALGLGLALIGIALISV